MARLNGCKFTETSVAINDKVDEVLAGMLKQIRLNKANDLIVTNKDQNDEEIRLTYVALTRASQQLFITWSETRKGRITGRSDLISEIADISLQQNKMEAPSQVQTAIRKPRTKVVSLEDQLIDWRSHRARIIIQQPNAVLDDQLLSLIASQKPKSIEDLGKIIGQITASKIGPELLSLINKADASV